MLYSGEGKTGTRKRVTTKRIPPVKLPSLLTTFRATTITPLFRPIIAKHVMYNNYIMGAKCLN